MVSLKRFAPLALIIFTVVLCASVFVKQTDAQTSIPVINDLRVVGDELRWTAPPNISQYHITYFTGEATSNAARFYGCRTDIFQLGRPNGTEYCAGQAISISHLSGRNESLRIRDDGKPTKTFVIEYTDVTGRRSPKSNVAIYRDEPHPRPATIEDLRIVGDELRWVPPINAHSYQILFHTGETNNRNDRFTRCDQDGRSYSPNYCVGNVVSRVDSDEMRINVTQGGNSYVRELPVRSYVVISKDRYGNESGRSNVATYQRQSPPAYPPITNLRIVDDEILTWTAPVNVKRYFIQYYTGETTTSNNFFGGCAYDYSQIRSPNGRAFCAGTALQLNITPGGTSRVRIDLSPTKSFVVTYEDIYGNRSENSNVVVFNGDSVPPIEDLSLVGNELRWTAPPNVSMYYITYLTGESSDSTNKFPYCDLDINNRHPNYCAAGAVSVTHRQGHTERVDVTRGNNPYVRNIPVKSFTVTYKDIYGNKSRYSNVVVYRGGTVGPPPPIEDLRLVGNELRWTAPHDASRYYITYYTGETNNRNLTFGSCGGDENNIYPQYCAGRATSITHRTGHTERLDLSRPSNSYVSGVPVKSFVVRYVNSDGRSANSNVVTYTVPPDPGSSYFVNNCTIGQASYDGRRYHFEIWHRSNQQKDSRCISDQYRIEDWDDVIVHRTTNQDLIVEPKGEEDFTVYFLKDGLSISRDVDVRGAHSQRCELFPSWNGSSQVIFRIRNQGDNNGAYCHFDADSYDILSGALDLDSMTEFSLTFNTWQTGRVRIKAASPSSQNWIYQIDRSGYQELPEESLIPPAGYEDDVITTDSTAVNPFSDTNMSTLEGQAAAWLYAKAILGGYSDGEFKGERYVNRAEGAKVFVNACCQSQVIASDSHNNGQFWDVKDGEWYVQPVMAAARLGIISGHPNGSFKPGDRINKGEFMAMFTRAFDLPTGLSYSYRDVSSSDWYAQFAGAAQRYELFPRESSSTFDAGKQLTRYEVAVAIYQYLNNQ